MSFNDIHGTIVDSRHVDSDTHVYFKNKLKRFSIDSAGPEFEMFILVTLFYYFNVKLKSLGWQIDRFEVIQVFSPLYSHSAFLIYFKSTA